MMTMLQPHAYPVPPMLQPVTTRRSSLGVIWHPVVSTAAAAAAPSVFPPMEEAMALDPCVVRWQRLQQRRQQCDNDVDSSSAELAALGVLVTYLRDRGLNPHQGSLPLEKLMNVLRLRQPILANVVGTSKASFLAFVERHSGVLGSHLDDDGLLVRIFLRHNVDYALRDAAKGAADRCHDEQTEETLTHFLAMQPGQCATIDACMEITGHRMRRGDLARFLRMRQSKFELDRRRFLVRLLL